MNNEEVHRAVLSGQEHPRLLPVAVIAAVLVSAGLIGASGYFVGVRSQRPSPAAPAPAAALSPTLSPASTRSTDRMPIASSASGPTARQGWRKYRNETYGYSIEHPEPWLVG